MPSKLLRASTCRRSAVCFAHAALCWATVIVFFRPLLHHIWLGGFMGAVRLMQLAMLASQGCMFTRMAVANSKGDHAAVPMPSDAQTTTLRGLLSLLFACRCHLACEAMRVALHALLSWYPLAMPHDMSVCVPPRINILVQQAMATASASLLGTPIQQTVLSGMLFVPSYIWLDWRFAYLNGLPGCQDVGAYMLQRGVLILAGRLFFSAAPAIVMMHSRLAPQLAVYAVCLPLLAVQYMVSGYRVFNGMGTANLWEVWVATAVAFAIGADMGHVVEELRIQFSKVRSIACDVLPHHVVDSLIQQPTHDFDDDVDFDDSLRSSVSDTLFSRDSTRSAMAAPATVAPPPSTGARSAPVSSNISGACAGASPTTESIAAAAAHEHASAFASIQAQQAREVIGVDRRSGRSKNSSAEPLALMSWPSASVPAAAPARTSAHRRLSANKLTDSEGAEYAEEHPGACVLFADVCGFTSISEGVPPSVIVHMLNTLFRKFDELISESPYLYKLDVIGDSYMVASGLSWHADDPCPARTITDFAKLMLLTAATVLDPVTQQPLRMRCGIHRGPVVGALLGCLRRKYSLFGDVVNAASRLESTAQQGAVHISAAVYEALQTCAPGMGPVVRSESLTSVEQEFYSVDNLAGSSRMQASPSGVLSSYDSIDGLVLKAQTGCCAYPPMSKRSLNGGVAALSADATASVTARPLSFASMGGEGLPCASATAVAGGIGSRMRLSIDGPCLASLSIERAPSPACFESLVTIGERIQCECRGPSVAGCWATATVAGPGCGPWNPGFGVDGPRDCELVVERWQHQGWIKLKGRAPLEAYMLQVL